MCSVQAHAFPWQRSRRRGCSVHSAVSVQYPHSPTAHTSQSHRTHPQLRSSNSDPLQVDGITQHSHTLKPTGNLQKSYAIRPLVQTGRAGLNYFSTERRNKFGGPTCAYSVTGKQTYQCKNLPKKSLCHLI